MVKSWINEKTFFVKTIDFGIRFEISALNILLVNPLLLEKRKIIKWERVLSANSAGKVIIPHTIEDAFVQKRLSIAKIRRICALCYRNHKIIPEL